MLETKILELSSKTLYLKHSEIELRHYLLTLCDYDIVVTLFEYKGLNCCVNFKLISYIFLSIFCELYSFINNRQIVCPSRNGFVDLAGLSFWPLKQKTFVAYVIIALCLYLSVRYDSLFDLCMTRIAFNQVICFCSYFTDSDGSSPEIQPVGKPISN